MKSHWHSSVFNLCPRLQYSRFTNLLLVFLFILFLPVLEVVLPITLAFKYSIANIPQNITSRTKSPILSIPVYLLCILVVLPILSVLACIVSCLLLVLGTLPL